jgi:hypothetical protein
MLVWHVNKQGFRIYPVVEDLPGTALQSEKLRGHSCWHQWLVTLVTLLLGPGYTIATRDSSGSRVYDVRTYSTYSYT